MLERDALKVARDGAVGGMMLAVARAESAESALHEALAGLREIAAGYGPHCGHDRPWEDVAADVLSRLGGERGASRFVNALVEFHGHPNSILDDKTNGIPLRRTLLEEEVAELFEAMDEDDLSHIAREMADVLYVVFGTALVYGIDLDAAFEEVHRAAMDKMRAGLRREDGKIIKPPGFRPPDMTAALASLDTGGETR